MLTFRHANESDYPYVIDSFYHGFRGEPWAQGCSADFLTGTMRSLLDNPAWQCTVLCESDTPTEILGYVVWRDPQTIAWICVKRAVQDNGFAKKLLATIGHNLTITAYAPFFDRHTKYILGTRLQSRPFLPFQ